MRLKMLQSFSGDWSCASGDIIERPDEEAIRLIDAGFAIPMPDSTAETAVPAAQVETTSKRRVK